MQWYHSLRRTFNQVNKWMAFVRSIKPSGKFGEIAPPAAPDYANWGSWAARPEIEDKSHLRPHSLPIAEDPDKKANVFYLHPTSFFGNYSWNASIDNPIINELVDESMIPAQATAFNGCCHIYAPYYRQATFYAFLQGGKDGRAALELAYEDIKQAFLYFFHQINQGKPYFIASHSQGTLHATRLLEEVIDTPEYAKNLVAAYTLGFRVPLEKAQQFSEISICSGPEDTRCIIGWDTYLDGTNPHRIGWPANKLEHYYDGKWRRVNGVKVVGINPYTWTNTTDRIPADAGRGAIIVDYKKFKFRLAHMSNKRLIGLNAAGLSDPYMGEVATQLRQDGILYISKPQSEVFNRMVLPNNSYHNYDYPLFYMDIRTNVQTRLDAFLKKQHSSNS